MADNDNLNAEAAALNADAEAAMLSAMEDGDWAKLAGIPFRDAVVAWDRVGDTGSLPKRPTEG